MANTASPIAGLHESDTAQLTRVPLDERNKFRELPLDLRAHLQAHASVPAFREVETGGVAQEPAATPVHVAAWNLERCLYPEACARLLRQHGVQLALLTELDCGMLRTGQRHTTADIAGMLGARYAYGLEFLELLPMPPPPGFAAVGEDNQIGFHGNGIVSALPFSRPAVIRLEQAADWFIAPKGGQRRVGNRMAVGARVTAGPLQFFTCSVHLESATDGAGRAMQFRTLLDSIDICADGLPVLIGGDLNTHVGPGGQDDDSEPLFSIGRKRGYDFSACNLACPTTRTSIWSESEGSRQLDWFCTRGLNAADPAVIPALGPDGTVLTDHEMILVTIVTS